MQGRDTLNMKGKKMKKLINCCILSLICVPALCFAHFGMIIPSDSMVMPNDEKKVQFN